MFRGCARVRVFTYVCACVYIVWGSRRRRRRRSVDQEGADKVAERETNGDRTRVYAGSWVVECWWVYGVCRCKCIGASQSEGRREGGKIRNRAYTARARDDVVLAKRGRRTGGQTIRCV